MWSGSRLACLPLPFTFVSQATSVVGFAAGLSPTSFHLSPAGLSPTSFHSCPTSFLLVVGFPAGLSPTSFHLSPTSFHLSTTSFQLSPRSFHLSRRLGACGRVPGWLVSHFLECVSHFFSFVSQAGCLSPTSFPFVCVSLLFICLPGWVLVVGFPGGLSPTSLHLSPTFSPNSLLLSQFFLKTCPPFVSLLVSAHFHWPCNISIHPSPRSVSVGVRPLPGLSLVVSALFRWSCSISCHLSPRSVTAGDATFLFICLRGLSLAVPPFSAGDATFLFICFPGLSLLMSALFCWPCSISVHLSPRPITGSVRPFLLAM